MLPSPRIFCIPATDAPVVAVLRRGPSDWFHVGRWELEPNRYVPGAWLHGALYEQRCDLSPDGRWLAYFALLPRPTGWAPGSTYIAVSRLPWLTALAAWGTDGTWTQGAHFVHRNDWTMPDPDYGDPAPLRQQFGLALTSASSYAVERRRGWTEASGTPPRLAGDAWDTSRGDAVTMQKPRPGSASSRLLVSGAYAGSREGEPGAINYRLEDRSGALPLPDVQWADWSARGQLLVATTEGRLQVRNYSYGHTTVAWEYDLAALSPDPTEPPPEARHW